MAESDTLLAHMILDLRLTIQTEVAATKALAYTLTRSSDAMKAFNAFVRDATNCCICTVESVQAEVAFESESEGSGRPDLEFYDGDRERRVMVEAKFGAKLLKGQGSVYLSRLSANGTSVLMFLVPDYRIETLWDEVKDDITSGKDQVQILTQQTLGRRRVARILKPDSFLIMVSWRELLENVSAGVCDDATAQSNIHQLRGLTERMDVEQFHPLREGEFSRNFGRRTRDLRRIYDGVLSMCINEEVVSTQRLSTSNQPETGFGRYLRISDKLCWFGVYIDLWLDEDFYETPFWLNLFGCESSQLASVRTTTNIRQSNNSRLKDPTGKYFPLKIKLDAGLDAVIEDIVNQIKNIAAALKDDP